MIGTFRSERIRTIIIKRSNVWEELLILSSAAKLRSFEPQLFVSHELTPSKARLEFLKRRRKLIDEGTDRRDLRIKQCQQKDDSWMEVKPQSTEASNCLDSETIMTKCILLYIMRSGHPMKAEFFQCA